MDKIKTRISKIFYKQKIVEDVEGIMCKLMSENKINEFMSFDAVYTTVLMYLSNKHKIFEFLLSKKYLYDLDFFIKDKKIEHIVDKSEHEKNINNLRKKVENILCHRIEYVYVSILENKYFVGIKFNDSMYEKLKDVEINKYKIPYYLITKGLGFHMDSYDFNGIFFEFTKKEVKESYKELIDHLKNIRLPLSIIDEEIVDSSSFTNVFDVFIYLEYSNAWPDDNEAVKYAKTAFYLEIYKKSKYRSLVEKEFVILRYRKTYFRIKIVIKQDKKVEYNVKKNLYGILNKKSEHFRNNLDMVKLYLSKHGFYPIYFSDFFVDIVSLIIDEEIISPSKFFEKFLRFNFDLEYKSFDLCLSKFKKFEYKRFSICYGLDNLFVNMPDKIIINRLCALNKKILKAKIPLFSKDLKLNSYKLLNPNVNDFDFVLSYDKKEGFKKIQYDTMEYKKENHERKNIHVDLLGASHYSSLITYELLKSSHILFSETNKLLMVKCKDPNDIEFLRLYLITATNFNYVFVNTQ